MSVRTLFGARIVAVTGLAAVVALAGCSSQPSFEHPAASPAAGTATTTPVARTTATATPIIAPGATAAPVLANITTPTSQLTVDCDAFARQPKATAHVHLKSGDVLAVTLCSNASTGFEWQQPIISGDALSVSGVSTGMPASGAADAGTSAPPVGAMASGSPTAVATVNQSTLVSQGPSDTVGAATTTTFVLKAEHAGTATATLSYSRPWAGGEKGVWEYTIDVTID